MRWVSEQVRSEDVEEEVEGRYRYDTSGNHNSRSCDNAVVRLIACSCSNERPTSAARFTFVTRGAGGTRGERSIVYLPPSIARPSRFDLAYQRQRGRDRGRLGDEYHHGLFSLISLSDGRGQWTAIPPCVTCGCSRRVQNKTR